MKHLQFKVDVDEENGVISLKRGSAFEAYKVSRGCASVITSKKSSYAEMFSRYGVYILVEDDGQNPFKFYVGKAGVISTRFVSHVGKHSEENLGLRWTDAIVFVSTSHAFPWGEDEIAWFEHSLLGGIIDANRYQYTNSPGQTKAGIVDEEECASQLANMKFIVSLLGYPKLFVKDGRANDDGVVAERGKEKLPKRLQLEFWGAFKEYAERNALSVKKFLTQKHFDQNWYDIHIGLGDCHILIGESWTERWVKIGVWSRGNDELMKLLRSKKSFFEEAVGGPMEENVGVCLSMYTYRDFDIRQRNKWHEAFSWYVEKFPLLKDAMYRVVKNK